MKKLLFLLVLLFALSSVNAQNDKRLKGVEKELNEVLELTKAAGFAVAVVEKDKVVYAKGFGYRDFENQVPVDANTLFAIGSSTKSFTSALLGKLREEDKLSFDDKPSKYVPELEFYNEEMNGYITIKDLMCHRTGLPRHDLSWYFFPTDSKDSLIERIQHHEPFTGLREQWYYNNFMFLTQGVITERITGKSWEENIREHFFQPLGMDRSVVSLDELKEAENAAFGYELKNDSLVSKMDYYQIGGMSPAGSIFSSVNDMSEWLKTWINNGKYADQQIIPASYISEAISPQMIVRGGVPDSEFPGMHFNAYGYGWFLMSYDGHYRVSHGGNIDGFSADVTFFPTDSLGIVVLANQNGSAVPNTVRNILADRMLTIEDRNWVEKLDEQLEQMKENLDKMDQEKDEGIVANTRPSHILLDYTGTYDHPGYGSFKITMKNDSLFAHFKLMKFWLRHLHYDIFEPIVVQDDGSIDSTARIAIRLSFVTNSSGDVSYVSSQIEPALDPIEFKRTPISMDVSSEDLKKYTGDYNLMGTSIKVYVKDDKLYLFVQGQPEYELIATAKHKFSFKALEGFKVEFRESDDGTIKEALLMQPHGNFTIVKSE